MPGPMIALYMYGACYVIYSNSSTVFGLFIFISVYIDWMELDEFKSIACQNLY